MGPVAVANLLQVRILDKLGVRQGIGKFFDLWKECGCWDFSIALPVASRLSAD